MLASLPTPLALPFSRRRPKSPPLALPLKLPKPPPLPLPPTLTALASLPTPLHLALVPRPVPQEIPDQACR